MSQVALVGPPQMLYPSPFLCPGVGGLYTSLGLDATADEMAIIGQVHYAALTGKSIRKIHFRAGAITAGTNTLEISLRDPDTANGPVIRPDSTADQTVSISNFSGLTQNVMNSSGNFSADRSVTAGDWLAVMFRYTAYTSGALKVAGFTDFAGGALPNQAKLVRNSGGWADPGGTFRGAIIILEFTDGTFGTLRGAVPFTTIGGFTDFNSGSSPASRGMSLQVPFPCKVLGIWAHMAVQSGANCDLKLYDNAGTAQRTHSIDSNRWIQSLGTGCIYEGLFATEYELAKDTEYRIMMEPTTANTVRVPIHVYSDAAHRAVMPGGTNWSGVTKSGSTFTPATTNWYPMGLIISSLADDVGGGARRLIGPHGMIG